MKTQIINTRFGKGLLHFLIILTSLMAMSFVTTNESANSYKVASSKVYFEGIGKNIEWKLQAESTLFDAKFTTNGDQLEEITNMSFSIPIDQLHSTDPQIEESIKKLFKDSECTEVVFTQSKSMILPIMKMIHMVGELKAGSVKQIVPMQMQYTVNTDGSIDLIAKQFLSKSMLGTSLSNAKKGSVNEEVSLNFVLNLKKN